MNWRTRCTKYSPTCPLAFTSGMTYRTVLTTGRDENTSCPVGTEYTISVGSACVRVWKRDCDVTSLVEHRAKASNKMAHDGDV